MRVLRAMEAEGLVKIDRDPADGRAFVITPTDQLIERNQIRWQRVADDAA